MHAQLPVVETRILAIASAGGHWQQLQRLQPVFEGANVTWATTRAELVSPVDGPVHAVGDGSLWRPWRLVPVLLRVLWLVLRYRPHVVISTGAAPGAIALVCGRLLGARTVWIDSMANADQVSRSGKWVRAFTMLWLTQWEHLADPEGPWFWGSIL